MYEAFVIGSVLSVVVAGVFYIRLMWRRSINPVPATWILLLVMISISFFMYWQSPSRSLTANIALTANFFNITMILIGVLVTNFRNGTLRVQFDTVQKWCLAGGVLVVALWSITNDPLVSYSLMQIIAIIAYFATAQRLWRAEQTTEPYFFWIASLISNLCALYPAWVHHDLFSWIFLARAIPSTALLIFLIWRIKSRSVRTVLLEKHGDLTRN